VVVFALELRGVVLAGKFLFPPVGVAACCCGEASAFFGEGREEFLEVPLDGGGGIAALSREACFLPVGKLGEVVGTACFGARSDGGIFPPTEGLAAHDRSGDGAVDVGIADLDGCAPLGDFLGVEGVDAAGETEIGGILDANGFIEAFDPDEGEDRAKQLRGVDP